MKKILLLVSGAALICAANFHAAANTIITNAGPGTISGSGINSNRGYDFTVGSTPLMITALGLWDGPNFNLGNVVGDGFASAHEVGLWDSSGTLLAKTTILPGMSGTLIGEFRYSSTLTLFIPPGPLILSANTTYVLGAAFLENDPDLFRQNTQNTGGGQATFDPAVSAGNARFSLGGFSFPSSNVGPGSFVGPNAIFSLVSNGNGVPEGGSTLVLMAVALAALLFSAKKFQLCRSN